MRTAFISVIVGGLLQIVCLTSCFETCEQGTRRVYKDVAFNGTIDSIFRNEELKNQPCVVINGNVYLIRNDLYQQFSIEDTLFKHSGSMKYHWVKNKDTTVFYQMCGSKEINEVRD